MHFLNLADLLEKGCNLNETLLAGCHCKTCIHIGPLVVLTLGSIKKVGPGVRNRTAVKKFEPDFRVLLLIGGSLLEKFCNLHISVLLCL